VIAQLFPIFGKNKKLRAENQMIVYLVGMPGAGKTSCGMVWARQLGYKFYDMDVFIESLHGQSIPALFESAGESRFREIEKETLRLISQGNKRIIATGGGTPCFFDNMAFMKAHGLVIFLDCPVDTLIQRLHGSQEQRPLLQHCRNEEEIRKFVQALYEQRRPFYEQAHISLQHYEPESLPQALVSAIQHT
jgi:shikimate kinase